MVEIDGSYGEAGGQILRTALSLSCLLGKPFRIYNIRKGRRKPGLMPQHLTAVRAAALISGAKTEGDSQGSVTLLFEPSGVKSGDYFFDIGTAGSTSLVIQTLLLPLLFSKGQSTVTLKGGTHVPMSPPFDYIRDVFIMMLKRLGADIRAEIDSYGFYPKGGGKVRFSIRPASEIKPLNSTDRGDITSIKGVSAVAGLPVGIAERQRSSALKALEGFGADVGVREAISPGQGTFLFLCAISENSIAGFSSLGERGKRAEAVGEEAAKDFLDYHLTGAALDPHMADQIAPYLSLAKGESIFTVSKVTNHLITNLWLLEKFLDIACRVEGEKGSQGRVIIKK